MGLDMYLTKKIYIGNNHKEPAQQVPVAVLGVNSAKVKYIEEDAGYWRKANAIHAWLVKNVQGGTDDCKEYMIGRDDMKKLLDLCIEIRTKTIMSDGMVKNGEKGTPKGWEPIMEKGRVMVNPEIAQRLLPTQEGFFFGGTGYDESYMQDIDATIQILSKALEDDTAEYYYQSSW